MINFVHPWIRVMLVARCNKGCVYCSTLNHPFGVRLDPKNYAEAPASYWIRLFSKIPSHKVVSFSGGEPTLHEGFNAIVDSLFYRSVRVLTNASSESVDKLIKLKNRRIHLSISYHLNQGNLDEFGKNIVILRKEFNNIEVHGVSVPMHTNRLYENVEYLGQNYGIKVQTHSYTGILPNGDVKVMAYQSKEASCGKVLGKKVFCKPNLTDNRASWYVFAPNGDVYYCMHFFALRKNKLGNVFKENVSLDPIEEFECMHYGMCSICEWGRKYRFEGD